MISTNASNHVKEKKTDRVCISYPYTFFSHFFNISINEHQNNATITGQDDFVPFVEFATALSLLFRLCGKADTSTGSGPGIIQDGIFWMKSGTLPKASELSCISVTWMGVKLASLMSRATKSRSHGGF